MKLYLNRASPYARLIRVLLIEFGLDADTELAFVDPWDSPDALVAANPASKVPALVLADGTRLVESACIADYLVQRSGMRGLSPSAHLNAEARLQTLGLGRAAIDCAFGGVIQRRFHPRSPLARRWLAAVPRIAGALDDLYAGRLSDDADLADLTVAVAFEYVDFRLAGIGWRDRARHLARRVDAIGRRPSVAATRPG